MVTTIIDPLVEEAVIQSKRSMFDEYGQFRQPKDPKEIYLKLLKDKNRFMLLLLFSVSYTNHTSTN